MQKQIKAVKLFDILQVKLVTPIMFKSVIFILHLIHSMLQEANDLIIGEGRREG